MKKTLTLLLAAVIAVSACALTACGEENSTPDEASAAATAAPTEAAAEKPTKVTAEYTVKATEKPTAKPTEKPTEEPAVKPTEPLTEPPAEAPAEAPAQAEETAAAAVNSTPQSLTAQSSVATFVYNGASVELGENINSVISKIGKASGVTSAPSCHGVGEDKTYTYSGFEIYTYPQNGGDYVCEILVTGSVATSKGVKVGDSESQVISAYGSSYSKSGYFYVYDAGNSKSIQFYIMNGTVQQIDYYYDI